MRETGFALAGLIALAAPGAAPDPDWAARLVAERAELDRRTREGETTPFTPIDVRMIAAGERIVVALCDGGTRFDPPGACEDRVALAYDAETGFRQVAGDGSPADAPPVIPLGRLRLALSRQEDRGRILVHDPQAPAARAFGGYRWFPPDPALRFAVAVEPFDERRAVRLGTTAGLFKTYQRYGRVRFRVAGAERSLAVYLPEDGDPSDPGAFFIPFRDATSGKETYAVGRYVPLTRDEDGTWILDFNRAGNPNCAYNPHWNCPIPPSENALDVPIRAGELPYGDHGGGG